MWSFFLNQLHSFIFIFNVLLIIFQKYLLVDLIHLYARGLDEVYFGFHIWIQQHPLEANKDSYFPVTSQKKKEIILDA